MKETRFIAQNKEKWKESEDLLKEAEKDPEKLSNLFTQVIDDLSYSRTYYPNRSVRVYLNRIAREYFSIIYSHHRNKKSTFKQFWLDELPQIVYQSRRPLIISFFVFIISLSIGVFSSVKDPDFATSVLGESYIAMTKANIEEGDPMAVYKQAHQVEMFLGITLNNLRVAFQTYVLGVFFSIGTLAILLYNGIMVGCFQFFFIERGLLAESALTIWLHGTLEISSIILAGGAGLTLGSGLLFPGSYSRLQAFQLNAIRSLKLMLGIAPVFVIAAIIESFLTRYTEMPDLLRLLLIIISAVFILGYFVVYPWMKSRRGFAQPLEEAKLPPSNEEPVSFSKIKNNGELIRDSFSFYRKHFRALFFWISVVTFAVALAEFLAPEEREFGFVTFEGWWSMVHTMYYAMKTPSIFYLGINTIATALIFHRVFLLMDADATGSIPQKFRPAALMQTMLVIAFGYAIMLFLGGWGVLMLLGFWSFLVLACYVQHSERTMLPASVSRTIKVSSENLAQVFGIQLIVLLLSFSFLVIVSAPLVYMNTTILQWNFAETDKWSAELVRFVTIFVKLFAFNLVLPIFGCCIAYLYFSLKEIYSADNLRKSISLMSSKYIKSARK